MRKTRAAKDIERHRLGKSWIVLSRHLRPRAKSRLYFLVANITFWAEILS
ncbi:hypothetical protein [Agrobacterium rosae]